VISRYIDVQVTWFRGVFGISGTGVATSEKRAHTAGAQPPLASAEGAKLRKFKIQVLICILLSSGNKIPRLSELQKSN
jgi:hypothetical protein